MAKQPAIRPWSDANKQQLQTDAPKADTPQAEPTLRPWSGPAAPQSLLEPEYHAPYHDYKSNPTPQTADVFLKAGARPRP